MLSTNPVQVNLFNFINNGEFANIKVGQTKEWIINNFPDPDYINDMGDNMFIWQYGTIEFHFDGEMLFLIFCDNFHKFNAGKTIDLEKWIFKSTNHLTLEKVVKVLNKNKISFTLIHKESIECVIIKILASNVSLYFAMKDQRCDFNRIDPNTLHFDSFSLTHDDYMSI